MLTWSFFCLFLKKNILRETIYFMLSILSIVLFSCNEKKGTIGNYSLFESKKYEKMDSKNKLTYLDSINSFSNSLKNDSINRIFLFNLSAEYYYLKDSKKSFKGLWHCLLEFKGRTRNSMVNKLPWWKFFNSTREWCR